MNKLKIWFLSLINVYDEEFVEVTTMWSLSFIYRIAMVLGWTVLVAFFIGAYGVRFLPVLIALHAFGNILGSLFFGNFLHKISKSDLSLYLSLVISFLFGITAFVYKVSPELFLVFGLVSISIFLSQFKIIRSLFAESIFSPTQASRVFPVIESAETMGVLIGGALVAFLSVVLPLYKIFLVMMALFLLCVPILFWYMHRTIAVPFRSFFSIPELGVEIHEDENMTFTNMVAKLKFNKFIFYLFLIVLLQFFFFGILEFHFTSVVEEFSKTHHLGGDISKENSLASDLGLLHSVFAAVVLVFQLFIASRVLKLLGIVNTMVISPLVMIISTIGMIIGFGFPSVVVSRFNQEVTHVLHYNAYHTSYYALSHKMRAALMEFLEGVVRPVGTILSMVALFVLAYLLGDNFILFSNILGLIVLVAALILTKKFESEFDNKPLDVLRFSNSISELMNAVDVMTSMRSKDEAVKFLKDIVEHRSDLPNVVEGRIWTFIGDYGEANDIFFLIEYFEKSDCNYEILESVNDIYLRNKSYFLKKQFTSVVLHKFYNELLESDIDELTYRELIIFLCVFYMQEGKADEIINLFEKTIDDNSCLAFVESLEGLNDVGIYELMQKYLNIDSSKIRIALNMILRKYMKKDDINLNVRSCLVSSDSMSVVYGLIYLIKYNQQQNFSLYDKLISDKSEQNMMIEFFYEYLKYTKTSNEFKFKLYLNSIEVSDLKEYIKICKEWSVFSNIESIVRERLEAEIYTIYNEFAKEKNPEAKLELLYRLKQSYRDFGARKEYFMLKDLLS